MRVRLPCLLQRFLVRRAPVRVGKTSRARLQEKTMQDREIQHCIRCGGGLRAPGGILVTGDQALAVYQEIVTVGFRPRARSKKIRSIFCVPCGASLGYGPAPQQQGLFYVNLWDMMRDLLRKA